MSRVIMNKKDLKYFLERDRIALYKKDQKKPHIFGDEIWKYQILLRKLEYYSNTRKNKILRAFYSFRFHNISLKLGFSIPINIFGPGLSIAHYGTIVVNDNASVGENCRIQENVTIGATNGENTAPILGNNIFIGSGAKIIGDISIVDNVCIGAGSVVVKDIVEESVTVAGVPSKIVGKNENKNLCQDLFI